MFQARSAGQVGDSMQTDSQLPDSSSVFPEVKSNKSELVTLTQILPLETVTGSTKDSIQKTIPVSWTSTDTDLVLGRL